MNKQPYVSIIMPCLNVESYIRQCVDSVVSQTIFEDLDVLIIDAGSDDGTLEIVKQYESQYSNIHVVISNRKSYGYQVNLGLKQAAGKYVAILETDDYVRNDMYEILYEIAERKEVDYVKANHLPFVTLSSGKELYFSGKVWPDSDDRYGKVLDPTYVNDLYVSDFNIWKGIFRRDFILNNSIFASETPGAAYQDIGLMELSLSCADKALYLKDELYRYRTDRESSSMKSGKGLFFSKNEFTRLLEMKKGVIKNIKGLYLHMLAVFVGNMDLLEQESDILNNDEIETGYNWLKNQIMMALKDGIIIQEDINPLLYTKYLRIVDNPTEYIKNNTLKKENQKALLELLRQSKGDIYIFGAGTYGRYCFAFLDKNGIIVKAFYDNSPGTIRNLSGIIVIDGKKAINRNDIDFVIIANLVHREEIKVQLLAQGFNEDKIISWQC